MMTPKFQKIDGLLMDPDGPRDEIIVGCDDSRVYLAAWGAGKPGCAVLSEQSARRLRDALTEALDGVA
jgi:hypothetical protein